MTSLPTWAVYWVSLGTPAAAFFGALIGHIVSRKGAKELEIWRRREETMRMLRWATELAAADRPLTAQVGVTVLRALRTSPLLQSEDRSFIELVARFVVDAGSGEYFGNGADADDVAEPAGPGEDG